MLPAKPTLSLLYRQSTAAKPKIRVGLMLDSPVIYACFARVVDDILHSNFSELSFLVYNASAKKCTTQSGPRKSLPGRILRLLMTKSIRKKFLYERYLSWDSARNPNVADPFAMRDYSKILDNVPSINIEPIVQKFTHRFTPEAVAAVRERNLDVLLRFGFNIIRGDILQSARYGVWSFHHGDNDFYRGAPPHFWELVEQHPRSGVILQVLNDELDAGFVLAKGLFPTQQGLSVARNRHGPYWGTTHFVIQKLYELHQYGWDIVKARAIPEGTYQGKRKIYRTPNNWEMVKWAGPQLLKKAAQQTILRPFQPASHLHWRIAIRRSALTLLEEGPQVLPSFMWIDAPRGHYYADPMLFERDGKTWLFVEDYQYAQSQACISVAEVATTGQVGLFTPCLTRPYHLSYPFVFEHGGEIFMLPETGRNNTVELYRATGFPLEWKFEKVLLSSRAVDTTPLYRDGRWWIFTTIPEPAGYGSFGLLFSAEALTDPWTLHPASPISWTVETARSGGRIVEIGGKLVRPTQSCCPTYGYSLSLHEITRLDKDGFAERQLATYNPTWNPSLRGIHTYARSGEIELIDGCWEVHPHSVL